MNRSINLLRAARQVLHVKRDCTQSLFSLTNVSRKYQTPQTLVFKRGWASSTTKPNENEEINKSSGEETKEVNSTKEAEESTTESKLNVEVEKLKEDLAMMKEKYQRSIAENENVRTRLRKEIVDARTYGIQGFCKDLLEVADVLDKAVHSVPEEILVAKDHPDHDEWKNFYDGVYLTKNQLMKVFERHGLVPLVPERGDKFDPNIHEALFQAPVQDLEPGLVAHVNTIGYRLYSRTLRPAQVGVSKTA